MSSWPVASLGDVVQINPRVGTERASADLPVSFVPMAAVCEHTGRIVSSDVRPFGQVSKGFPIFAENDVLFAKITPCMENGKAAIARNLENGAGAGSTEFFVLRPTSRILSEYVFHFIRRTSFRATCKANFTGSAGQQRVPKSFLEKVAIPIPPLDEQRRIVGLLDRAAEIRRRADAARAKARAIIPALFLDMFGDPATNPKGWPHLPFGQITNEFRYGTNQKCHDEAGEGSVPVLRIPNVVGGQIDWSDIKHAALPAKEREKTRLRVGDLLFVRTNGNPDYIGRCANFDAQTDASYASYLIRARLAESMSPIFAIHHFNHPRFRPLMLRMGKTTAGNYNLSVEGLSALPVMVPPLALQAAFAETAQRLDSLARQLDAAAAKAEAMAAGLSAEVFG